MSRAVSVRRAAHGMWRASRTDGGDGAIDVGSDGSDGSQLNFSYWLSTTSHHNNQSRIVPEGLSLFGSHRFRV